MENLARFLAPWTYSQEKYWFTTKLWMKLEKPPCQIAGTSSTPQPWQINLNRGQLPFA
jgi:hypothetical protein